MPPSVTHSLARFLASFGLVLLLVLAGARPSWTRSVRPPPAASYTLTELGTVPGGGSSAAQAVNASGEITGHVATAGGFRAFHWDPSFGMRSLGTLPGDSQSYGTGISATGEVCGISVGANGPHAFVWTQAEGMHALPALASGTTAAAYGINVSGQVVGMSDYLDPKGRLCFGAVVWDNTGVVQQLPVLDSSVASRPSAAIAINDSGQVAGFQPVTETLRGRSIVRDQPFVWDAATGLKRLARSPRTGGRPVATNVSGQVLGHTLTANGQKELPSVWDPSGSRILDSVSQLSNAGPFGEKLGGINTAGEIVYSLFARKPGGGVATLYRAGAAVDLNRFVDPKTAVHLYTAAAINDSGQIIGALTDKNGTRSRAYLLTPRKLIIAGHPELPVNLRSAGNFTILAKAGISTTGPTLVGGNIGVSPIDSTAITGFGLVVDGSGEFATSPQVTGRVYASDYANPTPAMLITAVGDMETAYTDAAGRTNPDATEINGGDLGGLNLAPGLYKWSSNVTIPSDLTLSGNSNDVWIFQIAGTLNISSGKSIILNGARASNIFWQVAGQATLGTTSVFNGNILSMTAIVAQTGARLNGRALAQTAVTLDSNAFPGIPAPIPPTIQCPTNVLVNTDPGLCTASNVALGTPTTTGTGVVVTNNAPTVFPLGTTIVIWTATDSDGLTATCSQNVIVLDAQSPTITCPLNVTVPVDAGMMTASGVTVGTPVVVDNCPGVTSVGVRSDSQALTAPYPLGTTTITWTATDAAGNTASCPQTVTVTARPTITCPANVMVNTDPGLCTASNVALGTPTTTGTGVVVTNNAPTVFPLGVTIVTWTATDSGGLTATCQQSVTVRDAQAPTITCAADITVEADPGQSTASDVMLGTQVVMDNCPGVTFVGTRSDGQALTAPYPLGTTTITWTATDAAGNTASCPQTVTVTPSLSIACPPDVTRTTDAGRCTASNVPLGTPTTTGTGVTVTNNAPVVFPVGVTMVTWTATDSNNATVTCQQRVTVTDAEAPRLTCPPNIVRKTLLKGPIKLKIPAPKATDNCGFVSVISSPPLGGRFKVGKTTVTVTATDAAGNTTTCTFIVTLLRCR